MEGDLNVRTIVEDWLMKCGYTGLYGEGAGDGCGCRLDDLMPCDGVDCAGCQPGHVRTDAPPEDMDIEWSVGDWWISSTKAPEATE